MTFAFTSRALATLALFSAFSCSSSQTATTTKPETEKKLTSYWTELTQTPANLPSRTQPLPEVYRLLKVDFTALKKQLPGQNQATTELELPLADHTMQTFQVTEAGKTNDEQTSLTVNSKNYIGKNPKDASVSARILVTANKLTATVSSPASVAVIEPYAPGDTVHYISYFRSKRSIRHPNLQNSKLTKPATQPEIRK